MNKSIFFFLFLLLSTSVFGQDLVLNPGEPGVLNQAIANNPGRTIVLRRGFPYVITGEINITVPTTIRAEAGNGPRPIIYYAPPAGGTALSRMFAARANLTIDGIHMTGRDALNGIGETQIIRVFADNLRMTVNNCLFDDPGQAVFRTDNRGAKIYVTNSISSRNGVPSNPDNGRFVDLRGIGCDTLWIENSVIYNTTSRVIRDGDAGVINVCRFVNNTIVNCGQRMLEIGQVGDITFLNNILVNGGFLGRRVSNNPTRDQRNTHFVVRIDSVRGAPTGRRVIGYSNFFRDADAVAQMAPPAPGRPFVRANGDTVEQMPNFNLGAAAGVHSGNWENTVISEVLTFNNPVKFSAGFQKAQLDNIPVANTPAWDHSGIPASTLYSTPTVPRFSVSHDYGYPRSSRSFTAGLNGVPLGSNLFGFVTSTIDIFSEYGISFYPNPTTETIFIQGLDKIDRINIFNMNGMMVRSFEPSGAAMNISVGDLTSGAYLINVVDQAGKVSAKKFVKQ